MNRVSRRLKWSAPVLGATLLLGGLATGTQAQVAGLPDVVGQWTDAFEEGGAGTPRCVPAEGDTEGFTVCKPVAQASAVLPDGRVFYYNGIESQENAQQPSAVGLSPSSRDSQVRVLDLRSGTPQFITPAQPRGGQTNPNIEEGHQSYDDPVGAVGVPGRPGDGFVGSLAGELGVPESNPTSTPDDPEDNDGDMFCADLTSLADGRVLVVGGTDWYNEPALMSRKEGDPADLGAIELEGLRNANLFDPETNSFKAAGHMKYGRWYPALTELEDGKVVVVSGVTQLITDTQLSQVRRTETFDPATEQWTENYAGPESENSLPLQPRMILAPNGKVFYPGVGQMWGPFGQSIDEALFGLQQYFDPETKAWEVTGMGPLGARDGAFVVPLTLTAPYDKMDLLTFGGTLGPPPGSEVALPFSTITTLEANGNVTNEMTGNLNNPRWFSSGILLPDGKIMAVGGADKNEVIDPGTEIAVRTPELYDPATGQWTEVVDHARDRTYHNSALLLPDMRVLLGGHTPIAAHYGGANKDQGGPFANNDKDSSFEIWSPPYLFRGARPSITRAQAGIAYSEKFAVGTPQAGEIESVLLMKTPSPQHINDPDQRALALEFTKTGDDQLEVAAPPTGKVAPPGYYYLVVNKKTDQGPVPSVARIVHVGTDRDSAESIQPYPDDAPAPVGGSATPEEDTSNVAAAQQAASEAVPAGEPATAATDTAAQAYQQLSAVPAGTSRHPELPLLPAAAVLVAATATLTGRRWNTARSRA
ncbi:MAG TPA: galactose oxidase-like domain-containing protein [Acidimicrobiia bacterium]|nr:galactose oxidase-like domain-containing protein [Acidimicrobiia bacterium]